MKSPFEKINSLNHLIQEMIFHNLYNDIDLQCTTYIKISFTNIIEDKTNVKQIIGERNYEKITSQLELDKEFKLRKQNDLNFEGLRNLMYLEHEIN